MPNGGGAGFLFSFIVDGEESSWKNIECSGTMPGNDTSSRLLPDGTTNDTGVADRDIDISTFTITLTEMARVDGDARGDITSSGFGFVEGIRDDQAVWEAQFDGVTFANGTGLVCTESSQNASIPGEARAVTRLQAIGAYQHFGF